LDKQRIEKLTYEVENLYGFDFELRKEKKEELKLLKEKMEEKARKLKED
jgi:hypothetical protein